MTVVVACIPPAWTPTTKSGRLLIGAVPSISPLPSWQIPIMLRSKSNVAGRFLRCLPSLGMSLSGGHLRDLLKRWCNKRCGRWTMKRTKWHILTERLSRACHGRWICRRRVYPQFLLCLIYQITGFKRKVGRRSWYRSQHLTITLSDWRTSATSWNLTRFITRRGCRMDTGNMWL